LQRFIAEKDAMIPLRFLPSRVAAYALLLPCLSLIAQTASTPASIQQKLESDYAVSKAAADKSDIVTAGAVLVLKKDGLLMSATSTGSAAANTYRDGKISQGIWKIAKMPGFGGLVSHANPNATVQTRTFVAGEKFWVTKITVNTDGVTLELLSDPISDVRYYSTLRFPFKGALPTPEEVDTTVGEVLKVDPGDAADDKGGKGAAKQDAPATAAAAPAEAAPAPMAPIAPPPPPADTPPAAPKTIALKQTKDEVIANFGQPTKVVKLGTKEIDYYPDMKVTFVNNKVTDIQ
jgi:hypothetical protein